MSEAEKLRMDRRAVNIIRQGADPGNNYVPGSMEYRIGLVWPLTCEVASLCENMDVERRLQRDVVVISRRESQVSSGGGLCDGRPRVSSGDDGH